MNMNKSFALASLSVALATGGSAALARDTAVAQCLCQATAP